MTNQNQGGQQDQGNPNQGGQQGGQQDKPGQQTQKPGQGGQQGGQQDKPGQQIRSKRTASAQKSGPASAGPFFLLLRKHPCRTSGRQARQRSGASNRVAKMSKHAPTIPAMR